MDDFNGLADFEIESTSSTAGKLVLWAMLAVFALASMATTFAFFVTYAPGLGSVLHPEYGPYIAGVLGVFLFDLAGLGWTILRSQNSDTTRQFVIASIAAVVTIGLALLVSGLQVVLSSSFDVGLYTAGGGLSEFGQAMQLVGVLVMTAGFVLNFGLIAAYVNTSKGVTQATQNTQLRAYVTAGRFAADKARAELVTRQTIEGIYRLLPEKAAAAGRQNTADYMNRSFAPDVPSGPLNSLEGPLNPLNSLASPSLVPDTADNETDPEHADYEVYKAAAALLKQQAAAQGITEGELIGRLNGNGHGGNGANFTQRPAGR